MSTLYARIILNLPASEKKQKKAILFWNDCSRSSAENGRLGVDRGKEQFRRKLARSMQRVFLNTSIWILLNPKIKCFLGDI